VIEINVSKHTAYHSQINNKLCPLSSCGTTSAIMWLLDCGVPFDYPKEMQPEDYLTCITERTETYEKMRELAPWASQGRRPVPPRQVHVMLAWAVNQMVGREVIRFREDATYQELIAELARGRAALLSTVLTQQGHVVCLVGVRTRQDREELADPARVRIDLIDGWLVDDPYGDYWTGYNDRHGNDCYFPFDDFGRLTKELYQNRKWAHIYVG
jgi:hypothetical protein